MKIEGMTAGDILVASFSEGAGRVTAASRIGKMIASSAALPRPGTDALAVIQQRLGASMPEHDVYRCVESGWTGDHVVFESADKWAVVHWLAIHRPDPEPLASIDYEFRIECPDGNVLRWKAIDEWMRALVKGPKGDAPPRAEGAGT